MVQVRQLVEEQQGDPAVTLGEAKTFPPLKILSAKTVNTYVATNKSIDARGDADEPVVAKVAIIKKKAVSKKRPAVASDATAVKKKRTKSGKTTQKEEALALTTIAQEAVPLQTIAPSSAVPAETESAMENIILETADMETDERESDMVAQSSGTDVIMEKIAVVFPTLEFQLFISEADRMIETGNDTGDEIEDPEPLRSGKADNLSGATQSEKSPSTEIADIAPTVDGKTSDEESMSIDDLLATILHESKLPSSAGVVTKIQFGKSIEIRGVEEGDWYKTRLPKIPAADKGKSRSNFVAGHSLSAIDLIVLDMLSDLHRVGLEIETQMQVHGLTWEMTCYSSLFEEANDLWQRLPKHTVPLMIELSRQRQFDDTLASGIPRLTVLVHICYTLTGNLYPPPEAPPAGSKSRPAEKPGKPENTYRQQHTSPRGASVSNPSTESNTNSIRKATDKYANAIQGIKATTEIREPMDRNNSSTARSDQRKDRQWPRGILSTWEIPTHLQYTVPDANQTALPAVAHT
ncbi:hypothetical protein F511_16429 [Dorcoceras hygrometricum]|uniref:Uncharacterized protein n=1 Tax=Dorcoceras hygrometricum TaxID=472368 RepID=A0A2Z7AMC8_9LAMI|nr:hypothetical protein F511_16429 [Dorcoceras hygrometricum]